MHWSPFVVILNLERYLWKIPRMAAIGIHRDSTEPKHHTLGFVPIMGVPC